MATFIRSTSPPQPSSYTTHATINGLRQSIDRKMNHELAHLKQLGKVTKKSNEEEGPGIHITTATSQQSKHVKPSGPSSESELQEQLDYLKMELEAQYHQQIDHYRTQLLEQETQHRSQLVEHEKQVQATIFSYTEKVATSQLKVHQLTVLVEKQDRLIQVLMDQNDDMDWHSLHQAKQQLETAIGALKANMETNQAHMQMMMMVSTEIQTDFERQKKDMENRLEAMADELASKNALLLQYQQSRHTPASKSSYRPIINTPVLDTNRHPSLISSSSSSSSTSSTSSSPPPFDVSNSSTPPPSTDHPTIQLDQVLRQRAGSLDQPQPKPFWKSIKTKWRHS